ncbi:MAG: hypothetical protein AVDCRST_MAG56-5299 [uncultured Cytophagales bacterium]|uniref:Uncharacterized protein n=1 Tax=uncultured Cytophagales bacterium TaxID=158755 RepID=A0A6J4KA99_9SPHI|nr:MAG: hypothetical protein AVDCRST_MAG56-5299 [uncultured Cytophagales bacterium]
MIASSLIKGANGRSCPNVTCRNIAKIKKEGVLNQFVIQILLI